MQNPSPNVFTRPDTLFGVCQAIGEDFGFNPLILRIGFALPLFWNPVVTVGAYIMLGMLVGLSRLIVPNPKLKSSPIEAKQHDVSPVEQNVEPELALAA